MPKLHRVIYPGRPESINPFSFAVVSLSIFQPTRATSGAALIAHIPFSFFVGEVTFGAGPYLIEATETAGLFRIGSADCDSAKAVLQGINIPKQTDGLSKKLLFYCRWDRYFLAQVLVADEEPITPSPPSQPASFQLRQL